MKGSKTQNQTHIHEQKGLKSCRWYGNEIYED